jgi:hypothetical protein
MTFDAADLLAQSLAEARAAPKLPDVDTICEAFAAALDVQQDVYDQILVPHIGLGERLDIYPRQLETPDSSRELEGSEIWLFDARPDQSWLHAPLFIPFEDLDDTLTLVRRDEVPADILARLRPPAIAGVREALETLDWLVVDSGGYEGGRMRHDEFLEELGDHRWYRIDHDPATAAARFESWRDHDSLGGWSTNVATSFAFGPDRQSPARLATSWPRAGESSDFELAVAADLLDDPYALLRRLVWRDARVDVDRLGPLVMWKDRPDALFEFRDDEESRLADPALWIASELAADADLLAEVIDAWFGRITDHLPVEVPGLGRLHAVDIPAVELDRPRPFIDDGLARTTTLEACRVFAAPTAKG